jgi:hypothetical protein
MTYQPTIAEQFLAVNRQREDVHQRTRRFLTALKESALWRPDELAELQKLIEKGLPSGVRNSASA